jgi:hypothetical protein
MRPGFSIKTGCPGPGVYDLALEDKPVMLISHALGEVRLGRGGWKW